MTRLISSMSKVNQIKEGKASINCSTEVFYNPVQEFNRDLSLVILDTYLKNKLWEKGTKKPVETNFKLCEALSATGLRSIRYALELENKGPIKTFIANDLSMKAVELMNENIKSNGCDKLIVTTNEDACLLLYKCRDHSDKFLVIDIDPYGSAAPFFDASVQALADGGLLMITCTDVAILCGNASETCFAKYGSMSLRTESCHEMALRIVLHAVNSSAARYGRYIVPLLSISVDFYVRLFVQIFYGPGYAKMSASKTGMVFHCNGCESFTTQKLGNFTLKNVKSTNVASRYKFTPCTGPPVADRCKFCDHHHTIGGPIWLDSIHDEQFVKLIKERLNEIENTSSMKLQTFKRIKGIIEVVSEELLDVPLYYGCDQICRKINCTPPKSEILRSAFLNCGYRVSASHAHRSSFKTDAPNQVIWDIFRMWVKTRGTVDIEKLTGKSVAEKILKGPVLSTISFEIHPDSQPLSREKRLLRYQPNPSPFWGPKCRPGEINLEDEKRIKNQGKKKKKIENDGTQSVEQTSQSPSS